MNPAEHPAAEFDLVRAVRYWLRQEEQDRELKSRVASSLEEIKKFVDQHWSDLEKRRSKLIQTNAFKDETRNIEAALATIRQLVEDGRNISRIIAEIGTYLEMQGGDETFSGALLRIQLAEARDEYMCAFQDSIRGSRLSEVLDVLYFMPFSSWRSRAVETRNFRSPSAAEVLKFLEDLGQLGVDIDSIDPVQLAAVIRIKLGISPRMDYHRMTSNKLAERLTGADTVSRHTAKAMPLDLGFCCTTEATLADIRRWSAECFGSADAAVPAEIEAEMLQIAYLSADALRISGAENERSADFLWLLATVIAGDHAVLKDVLTDHSDRDTRHRSVRERLLGAKGYLDEIAVLADGLLLARWAETKNTLDSLTVLSNTIAFKSVHENGEIDELEHLKDRRAEVIKSLIKITEAIQLIEPTLWDLLSSPEVPALRPPAGEYLRALEPARLRDRNYRYSEQTKGIARQELANLRRLIGRMGEIVRGRSSDSAGQATLARLGAKEKLVRKVADGVEIGLLTTADLQARLRASLIKSVLCIRELRDKVEGVRRRGFKSEIQLVLNQLYVKIRMAIEAGDDANLDALDTTQTPAVAEIIVPALRDIMAAQTNLVVRVKNAKLLPAEKHPLIALTNTIKARLGDELRDVELVRAELVERAAVPEAGTKETAATQQMADCAAAANDALKPVKKLIAGLSNAITSQKLEPGEIFAAVKDLQDALAAADDTVTGNFAQIEALTADHPELISDYVEKFDRWGSQLSTLDGESGRLAMVTTAAAALAVAVTRAAALEKSITDTLRPLSGKKVKAEVLVPIRERCAQALAIIALDLQQVQVAREALAEATKSPWRIIRAASDYLKGHAAELDALETELKNRHSRIEKLHNLVLR